MTAAHCVRRLKRSKIRIILGDHDQTVVSDAEAKQRAVSAIIKHRSFDSNTYNHDIALLKLRKPITFTKNILPVCLPTENADPSGKVCMAHDITFRFLYAILRGLFTIDSFGSVDVGWHCCWLG